MRMMFWKITVKRLVIVMVILLVFCDTSVLSQVRLPKLISDGMVLQRNSPLVIRGWASPGERVVVSFAGRNRKATATSGGEWRVEFPQMKAGGPYTMNISAKNEIEISDILIGDVWLCAGQSNMVHQMDLHDVTYAKDIATANYPAIRHFKIPAATSLTGPVQDLDSGHWAEAVSEEVRPFSAVAYFFARKIYEEYNIPIGLINASVGGTPIEAWISEQGFRHFPDILETIEENKDTAYVNNRLSAGRRDPGERLRGNLDKGLTGDIPWFAPEYTPKDWRRINIPGYWEDQGARDLNGIVWYRREIEIPTSMAGREADLFLGRIVDADRVYVNGEEVGKTTYQYPQRRYTVRAGLLKPGKNLFAIRVTNFMGKGGFVPDKPYCLFTSSDTVDLKGYWQYKVGEVFPTRPSSSSVRGFSVQNQPAALFNAMVAPCIQYPLKGILWYQGESNAGRPEAYAALLQALIADWREKFDNAGLPFIYAQLPNFMEVCYSPSESSWAELREAQLKALALPSTAMTVNIDLGEWNDIHPDNKKDVGERMALAAQKIAYGQDVVYSGPLYQSHRVSGNRVIITFAHTGSGLVTNDGLAPGEFAIAGADKRFAWANATIDEDKVIVWSDDIQHPEYVRYAWADNPDNPNLYNKEGLPASPFRTGED